MFTWDVVLRSYCYTIVHGGYTTHTCARCSASAAPVCTRAKCVQLFAFVSCAYLYTLNGSCLHLRYSNAVLTDIVAII
jgi:hypothetical protein